MALPVAALLAGCAGPGQDIANRIRDANLPYVERVIVSPVNPLQGKNHDDVGVFLAKDVTDGQVRDMWCTVVMPADPSRLSPGAVTLEKGAEFPANGGIIGGTYVDPPPCDGASPSP